MSNLIAENVALTALFTTAAAALPRLRPCITVPALSAGVAGSVVVGMLELGGRRALGRPLPLFPPHPLDYSPLSVFADVARCTASAAVGAALLGACGVGGLLSPAAMARLILHGMLLVSGALIAASLLWSLLRRRPSEPRPAEAPQQLDPNLLQAIHEQQAESRRQFQLHHQALSAGQLQARHQRQQNLRLQHASGLPQHRW